MTERTSRASKWLSQHDQIPEMGLNDFAKLMSQGFGLLTDVAPRGKNYMVRISDRPPIPGVSEEFRSIVVMTHHRGEVLISPICILQVLEKFEKTKDDFCKVYNRFFSTFHAA
jgi:hypothetical protein